MKHHLQLLRDLKNNLEIILMWKANIFWTMIKEIKGFNQQMVFYLAFSQQLPFNIEDNQTIINSYEFTAYHEYLEDLVASISLFGMNANSFGEDDVEYQTDYLCHHVN